MLDQFAVFRVAVVGILLEHAVYDISRLRSDIRGESFQADRLAFDLFQRDETRALRLEGRTARDGVEKRPAEAVDVAAEVLGFVVEPLGRDVIRRAPDFAARFGFLLEHAGQTEVHDLGRVRVGEKNVAGFDVAMDETFFRGGLEALGDLGADLEHLRLGHARLDAHEVVERAFFHQLHGDVKLPVGLAERINADHVRVIDRCGDARFLLEFAAFVFAAAHFAAQHLERDHAPQGVVVGFEDRAHAAFANQFDQLEVVEHAARAHRLAAMRTINLREG